MMLDAVADADLPRLDQNGFCQRLREIDEARLGRFAVAAGDHAVNAGLQFVDADKKSLVALLINEFVGALFGSDRMKEDALGPMVGVEPDIKKTPVVGGPDHAAGRILNDVGKILAR